MHDTNPRLSKCQVFGDYEMTFKQAFLTSAIITYMLVVLLLLLRIDSK